MTQRTMLLKTMKTLGPLILAAPLLTFTFRATAAAGQGADSVVRVTNVRELQQAVAQAEPGTRIQIAPGTYPGGLFFTNPQGTKAKPIVIAAEDSNRPPIFEGGDNGMQLSRPSHIELRFLKFRGQTGNGLNLDDGGDYPHPATGIILHGISVSDVGPKGNHDGIKLSGIDDFRLENCTIAQVGGQAVDMVGCHRGVIANCHIGPLSDESEGIQTKGGSSDITVRRCQFTDAGNRAVNIGGSTGLQFFRPPLTDEKAKPFAEARNITVEGCTFVGGVAPVAFVGVDGAVVRFNTFVNPRRWVIRILQETRAPGFVPARSGNFTDNLIVFRSNWVTGGVNVGDATAPETFTFARNVWFCEDSPARRTPSLPRPETGGTYGQDPHLTQTASGVYEPAKGTPAARAGATALP